MICLIHEFYYDTTRDNGKILRYIENLSLQLSARMIQILFIRKQKYRYLYYLKKLSIQSDIKKHIFKFLFHEKKLSSCIENVLRIHSHYFHYHL